MKSRTTLALAAFALTLASVPRVVSQNVSDGPQSDAVLDAIQEFQNRDKSAPNEVKVVLPPPDSALAHAKKAVREVAKSNAKSDAKADAEAVAETATEPSAPPEDLAVRVEKFQAAGTGAIDPADVKLHAPFPAKPLAQPPAGWVLDANAEVPPFTREIEVSPGTRITLAIRPHVLVPEADGAAAFAVTEPGYDSALGYAQTDTVGAVLSDSLARLDEDSQRLDAAIGNLQQLLISLPAAKSSTKSKK